jgi:hypothetical protein
MGPANLTWCWRCWRRSKSVAQTAQRTSCPVGDLKIQGTLDVADMRLLGILRKVAHRDSGPIKLDHVKLQGKLGAGVSAQALADISALQWLGADTKGIEQAGYAPSSI